MRESKDDKNLQIFDVEAESPKFGGSVKKAGMYGQPQHKFIKESQKNPVVETNRKISLLQLSEHKTSKSAWISLNGIVYDVTSYIEHHPGGDELLEGCGKQSQKLFNEHHSWVNAKNILAHCVIGTLSPH